MFRRKKKSPDETSPVFPANEVQSDANAAATLLPPLRRGPPPGDLKMSGQASRPELNRRLPDLPPTQAGRRPVTSPMLPPTKPEVPEGKRLTVGRDICLSGEITACDVLVVEGTVDASLADSRSIEIAESGIFRGKAEIDTAEIAGRYEGNLIVRDRLFIRATGKVVGTVRYGRIEIECGGEISGEVQTSAKPGNVEEQAAD